MSESDGDQVARSVALEQAYVHEVYEQCAEKTAQSRHWPKIYQFLEELEPGALVCDIGCGNGKYLSVNQSIFKVGVDRCKRFTDIAREKENEVLICDNLALPFRDESFDAVLSIAVVHHFATTERRVHALKELARVLRIGGRLIISVWAMEQRHRKFESQDVLVPWPKAYCVNATDGLRCSGIPEDNETNLNQSARNHSTSKKNSQRKSKSKGYWIDPIFSPSPSTSSLSSPNETCYSFFRRALQKLAGGKRGSGNRPWFFETWQASRNRKNYESDENANADELPIELRGVEDGTVNLNKQSDSLSIKSKSVGDILEFQRLDLVRSRSSIPGLCSTLTSELNLDGESRTSSSLSSSKPRLVKQKTHFIDDVGLENPDNTAIQDLPRDIPDFQRKSSHHPERGSMVKQSSMNEELMSTDRQEEKARVRRNILKQASLNEELICKGRTFESLRDSLYSGNASRRFQLLKSGLTSRIKQSTTNIEVSGISIKNGFVRILQGWKSSEGDSATTAAANGTDDANSAKNQANDKVTPVTPVKQQPDGIERRLSREDGSDSSKDSSLQSDTSVDSEDSFASVIFVPKPDAAASVVTTDIAPASPNCQSGSTSAPPSPRVKHPPDIASPRLKLISMSPLAKQFPATSKSLPPPSPPGLSPRTLSSAVPRPFFATTTTTAGSQQSPTDKVFTTTRTEMIMSTKVQPADRPMRRRYSEAEVTDKMSFFSTKKPPLQSIPPYQPVAEPPEDPEPRTTDESAPLISDDALDTQPQEKTNLEAIQEDESRTARLKQIKELLKQKPGFAMRAKPLFPLVRCATITNTTRLECMTKVLPRLLSLDLYNPETDDLDSDSSGVSSPESVGSVISVISDERYIGKKDNTKSEGTESEVLNSSAESVSEPNGSSESTKALVTPAPELDMPEIVVENTSSSSNLLKAAATVASSLEDAVGTAIQKEHTENSPAQLAQRENIAKNDDTLTPSNAKSMPNEKASSRANYQLPEVEDTWSEECRQHLIDFTEKLSENLINDIDQYHQKPKPIYEEINDEPDGSYLLRRKSDIKMNIRYKPKSAYASGISGSKKASKYNDMSNTIAWLSNTNNGFHGSDEKVHYEENVTTITGNPKESKEPEPIHRSTSDDIMDFVMVSNTGEFLSDKESSAPTGKFATDKAPLRPGNSIESSDIGESIENTASLSDGSQANSTGRLCSSMVSLLSNNAEYPKSYAEKRRFQIQRRSASEETPSRLSDNKNSSECLVTTTVSNDTLSGSSSQESLPSDRGGGAITYHQYYHVFREGELDQLINKYVENLHIISSYYDHASWCIVAEKVQVWTI